MERNDLVARHNRLQIQYETAKGRVARERAEAEALRADAEDLVGVQAHFQALAQTVQQRAHERIAGVVSKCLAVVFPNPYEFKIHFDRKRGKTEARLVFERDGYELDPATESGGGVVDVAAFALRLSCLMLAKPAKRRILFLDEPMKHLSSDYRPAAVQVMKALSEEMGIQIVMVTHSEEFICGKVVRIG